MYENSERERDQVSYLVHYGVKGMKWGVRKRNDKVSKNMSRSHRRSKQALDKEITRINDLYKKYKLEAKTSETPFTKNVRNIQSKIAKDTLNDLKKISYKDIKAREVNGKAFWLTSKYLKKHTKDLDSATYLAVLKS